MTRTTAACFRLVALVVSLPALASARNLPARVRTRRAVGAESPSTFFVETFDKVTPPALPSGWVANNMSGQNPKWVTSTTHAYTPPNDAYLAMSAPIGSPADEWLDSAPISIVTATAQVSFFHEYAFSIDPGAHPEDIPTAAGHMEISVAGGAFQNVTDAGATFVEGGYNTGSSWIGQSSIPDSCCSHVLLNLPAAAAGTSIVLRWRAGASAGPNGPGGAQWSVDQIRICDGEACDVPQPSKTVVDSAGSHVWEPGETVTVDPYYLNGGSQPVSVTGTATSLTGPAGATYTIDQAADDYASIAAGVVSTCVAAPGCYTISVDDPATRPAAHWDAQLSEMLSNGIYVTRVMHIGASFADVPTSNQFYAPIENLFHHGVTAGCGGDDYCPDDPITRAQMAVFLLKGIHGGDYIAPACATTVFTDVPCPGGTFVDWVNQLAAENITGGCGGGKYCPDQPVTRGQMSVFLLKGEHGGAYVAPACAGTIFTDVVCPGAQFVDYVNELAAEGITAGCGGGLYCPASPTSRGQMAAYFVRAFFLVLYGP
jgi:hypothetical protein